MKETDFKGAYDKMKETKKFSFAGMLFGLQKKKEDPGLFVPFNKTHAKLGLEPATYTVTRWGVKVKEVKNVVTEEEIGEAIEAAANKKIHGWVNKVRGKLGMKPLMDWDTLQEVKKVKGAIRRTQDNKTKSTLEGVLEAIKGSEKSLMERGDSARSRRKKPRQETVELE